MSTLFAFVPLILAIFGLLFVEQNRINEFMNYPMKCPASDLLQVSLFRETAVLLQEFSV